MNTDPKFLHQQFLSLGRERNKITYKLLSLLPQVYKQKVYEAHGYATIYEYAGKLAGLSHSVVEKALKLEEKLKDKPFLQKAVETQGVHKVALVANIATPETEAMFADKVENMSKPALQQFSRECRGKIQTTFQIELDIEMMETFLKLKKEIGKDLSNKEALRRMLKKLGELQLAHEGKRDVRPGCVPVMAKNGKPQLQAKSLKKIPGEQRENKQSSFSLNPQLKLQNLTTNIQSKTTSSPNQQEINSNVKITRYIPISQKREVLFRTNGLCSHENCHNPAQILHHQIRFSQNPNHSSLIPLCKIHHEFAHNGITETMTRADEIYRKYRQTALL